MTQSRLHTYLGGLSVLISLLALANWNLMPERAISGIAAVVTMAFIWLVVTVQTKRMACKKRTEMEKQVYNHAVIFAGLLLAFSLAAHLTGHIFDLETSFIDRARNIFSGFILLYFANLIPKMIGPALKGKCSNTTANAVRRFTGWALVLGYIGYIAAWAFAPITHAGLIATICLGTAVVLLSVRVGYAVLVQRKTRI